MLMSDCSAGVHNGTCTVFASSPKAVFLQQGQAGQSAQKAYSCSGSLICLNLLWGDNSLRIFPDMICS